MAARKTNERMEYYTNVFKNPHYIRLEDNASHLTVSLSFSSRWEKRKI